ncbi:MAG: hypothetical protein HPM95_12345 [Alphaproteobacteria bacterium]|nr:hypothetical protein [Alphaproteobacteria bacterium]
MNDTHGHEAGDALIRAFGRALAECCPPPAFPRPAGETSSASCCPTLDHAACTRFSTPCASA